MRWPPVLIRNVHERIADFILGVVKKPTYFLTCRIVGLCFVTPLGLVGGYQRYGAMYCLRLHGRSRSRDFVAVLGMTSSCVHPEV